MDVASILLTAILLGPPPPTIEPESQAPIEGPAPPPAEVEASEPGIEFAVEPPEQEEEDEPESNEMAAPTGAATWPDPGTAPSDGMGLVASGAILVPIAGLFSWQLLRVAPDQQDRVAIIATGASMGALAAVFIGTGLYRRAKLERWTIAYRVRALPQGSGLLSAGGIALSVGVSLAGTGIALLSRDGGASGATVLGIGLAGAVSAAPMIVFGKRRRQAYLDTGGWYRPSLPTVEVVPRLMLGRDSVGFGVAGRF